jgi:hypothetical protein
MVCTVCGRQYPNGAKFCQLCGIPLAVNQQSVLTANGAKKSFPNSLKVALGIFAAFLLISGFLGYFSYRLRRALVDATNEQKASNTGSYVRTSAKPSAVARKMGDTVSLGYWSYRVWGTQWKRSIGSEYLSEYPDAAFFVIDLSIRNDDRTSSTLPPFKLVDSQGREYDESSKAIYEHGSIGMFKSLNPSVESRGYAVFDVPKGTYKLKVSGGYTSGQYAEIELHK